MPSSAARILLFLLYSVVVGVEARDDLSFAIELPLSRLPFVRSHDSATGYLSPHFHPLHPGKSVISRWTATQNCTITEQLDCGARALDFRPLLKNGKLVMHHGPVPVDVEASSLVGEIVSWAARHPKQKDIILVDVWDCGGGKECINKVKSVFQRHGVHVYGCKDILQISIEEALRKAKLWRGGYVLAYTCHRDPPGWVTYDPKITCQGFEKDEDRKVVAACLRNFSMELSESIHAYSHDPDKVMLALQRCSSLLDKKRYTYYSCYDGSSSQLYPYQRLMYFDRNLTSMQPPDGFLYEIMGAWAENVESVVLGFLRASSLIEDEKRSSLNKNIVKFVVGHNFKFLPSMIGINNVCNGGRTLLDVLRKQFLSQHLTDSKVQSKFS